MNEYSPDPPADENPETKPNEFDELYELIDRIEASMTRGARTEEEDRPADGPVPPRPPVLSTDDPRVTHVPRWRPLHLVLFLLTFLSTFIVAGFPGGLEFFFRVKLEAVPLDAWMDIIANGLTYAGAVMAILLAHEMGHYLQARRYRVAASPPYFIPMPFTPLGTMGAVILQYSGYADRKKLYDIAISGPLAGLVLALPIAWIGIQYSVVKPMQPDQGMVFGDPLVMQWMYQAVHGSVGDNEVVIIGPLGFAGWVGIFITALNLIPIGQLDGGHILYSLIGLRAHRVALLLMGAAMAYMVYTANFAYSLMILLLLFMGPRHPPTANDEEELGWFRIVLGWLTLGFIIIGFTPNPISVQ